MVDRRAGGASVRLVGERGASRGREERRDIIIAVCPNLACGFDLIDPSYVINGVPALRFGWRYHNEAVQEGGDHLLHVSSIWDDHTVEPEKGMEIREGEVLDLFCPFCRQSFPTRAYCDCQAKMVEVGVRKEMDEWAGSLLVCARRRCPGHKKVRADEHRAVQQAAAGLEWMSGGGRHGDEAALRVVAARRQR